MIAGKIYEVDSFLTEDEINKVDYEYNLYGWQLCGGEHSFVFDVPLRVFLHKPLSQNEYLVNLFKSKVENIIKCEVVPGRLYGNAQANSQSAWVHTDDSEPDGHEYGSMVYYIHKNWKPQFGGHLIFVDDENDPKNVVKSIFPKSNSAVIFHSELPHMALEPTVYCKSHRESIAFKFKVIK